MSSADVNAGKPSTSGNLQKSDDYEEYKSWE